MGFMDKMKNVFKKDKKDEKDKKEVVPNVNDFDKSLKELKEVIERIDESKKNDIDNTFKIEEYDFKNLPGNIRSNIIAQEQAKEMANTYTSIAKKQKREKYLDENPDKKRLDNLLKKFKKDEIYKKLGMEPNYSGSATAVLDHWNFLKLGEYSNNILLRTPKDKVDLAFKLKLRPLSIFIPYFEELESLDCMYETKDLTEYLKKYYDAYKGLSNSGKLSVKLQAGAYGIAMGIYSRMEYGKLDSKENDPLLAEFADMMAKDLTEKGIVFKKLPEGLKQFVTEEKEQDNKVR